MFQRLSTRLTVLYAALFGAVLIVVSLAVFVAISGAAQRQVRGELAATGTVFDRIWSLRSERLREGAALLSRDFGFREAAATGDAPTIESALENLRARMGVDYAFLVGADGVIVGADLSDVDRAELVQTFETADDPSGVFRLGGEPYQLVSAPVLSPELIGWVVFAVRLDDAEMRALERLAAIPLQASVLQRQADGQWVARRAFSAIEARHVRRLIEGARTDGAPKPEVLSLPGGRTVALAKPLTSAGGSTPAVLLLRYPLAQALAPYQPLLLIVGLLGVTGLAVVCGGSWMLARSVTRPISILDDAAHRLQRGEDAHVEVESADEIGRLAESFNVMAAEIRERERKILHQALHDDDTGLPNRLGLEQRLAARPRPAQGDLFVCALGLDRFAHMRHAIGHALSAQAVRMVGDRLQAMDADLGVARISTDSLGFILSARSEEDALAEAERLLLSLEQPVRVAGEAVDVALSVGLAPIADQAAGVVIERASIALDQARGARRKAAVFNAVAYGDPAANLSLMSSLLEAIAQDQLELWHQAKYDFRRKRITGSEALVRWNHPVRGRIFPDVFIPMAEETGHIRALTEWVLRRAVADQKRLAEAGHHVDVAVNISGRVLGEPDFLEVCHDVLQGAVGRIGFEITETAVIENPDVGLKMLEAFARLGVSVSIDDYGSGLSSLGYLKKIRAQELKLDRSIVADVTGSQRDALIVRSTIDLAHSLGLKVVAEGIETEACFAALAGLGCDMAQGYLIARPQPLNEFALRLAEERAPRRRRA